VKKSLVALLILVAPLAGCDFSFKSMTPAVFTSPAASSAGLGSYTSSRTTIIHATATDNVGVNYVEFYVSGKIQCTIMNPPYDCPWQVPVGAGITYTFQTKAYDAQGNVGVSTPVQVTSN
jgi:hypothetical protein